uniref:uncharacterized protein LOC120333055 n=1 Tax=Styela clava TaxID=7725 RepID=UPI00193AA66D|nr:uncharacterized protein LOC120333055 [Styela clava]
MARSANFVLAEKNVLVQPISEHPEVECKKTDKVSVEQKNLAWKQIEAKFNATGTLCRRTEKNLKVAWKNIKNKAKQDNAQMKRHLRGTGGGPDLLCDELSEKVEALIPRQINCLTNNFDDDYQSQSSYSPPEEETYTLVPVAEELSSSSAGQKSTVLQKTSEVASTDRQYGNTIEDLKRRVLTEKLEAMVEERIMRREEHVIKMEYYRKKIAMLE